MIPVSPKPTEPSVRHFGDSVTASVGPPLSGFAERQYLAGMLVNAPSNAVAWIMNPKQFKPATVMPNLGVSSADAFDIAAYLYTSGDPKRIEALRRPGALHR